MIECVHASPLIKLVLLQRATDRRNANELLMLI